MAGCRVVPGRGREGVLHGITCWLPGLLCSLATGWSQADATGDASPAAVPVEVPEPGAPVGEAPAASAATPAADPAVEAGPSAYPTFGVPGRLPRDRLVLWHSDDESMWFTVGGYLQPRYEYTNDDSNMQTALVIDKFVLNKARLTFGARFADWAAAKIEFDLYDPNTSSPVLPVDVYASFPLFPYLEVRAGLMKVPLMYQRMMPGHLQLFAEPAMVVDQRALRKAGLDAAFSMSAFPVSDVGVMVAGDLFPWPHWEAMRDWPNGIVRYAFGYYNGYDLFRGTGKNDASLYAVRLEVNPFGARSYDESNPDFAPYVMLAFNWARSVDLNSNYDLPKAATAIGCDAVLSWQGVSLSGAWYRLESAGDAAYEAQPAFDPAFRTEGFYVQAAGFIPGWILREHLELKFRYQRYDPYDQVEGHPYTEIQEVEFRPQQITRPQDRRNDVYTAGFNLYFGFPGFPNRVKLSFDYNFRLETEEMWIADAWDGTQVRNDSWIVQLQFAM